MFSKINYKDHLNDRQKENYNFQKASSQLADYGFNCLRLSDDWQGADFIACHIDGNTFLKVQLKGRLTFSKKYLCKNIFIMFREDETWYLFSHDPLFNELKDKLKKDFTSSKSWKKENGEYNWPRLTPELVNHMKPYKI